MRTLSTMTVGLLFAALPMLTACGDDKSSTDGEAGNGNSAGSSNDGSGGAAGNGSGTTACDLSREGRDEVVLSGEIDDDMTLDASNYYTLEGLVYVMDGATLTVPPCTRIEGDGSTLGTLIVTRGGRLVADGKVDAPILFTSPNTAVAGVDAEPGDWGGVVILGQAPNSIGPNVLVEGLADDPLNQHGSASPDASDDSGVLRYVRIEYSGIDLGDGNEINGLSIGSVGSGTTISHVMISNTLDDCFEWFGGTVDADHLVCENPGDDMFDADDGYQGSISYLFGRHGAALSGDPNGFEWDGSTDNNGALDTIVEASHVTLCAAEPAQRGMVLRRGIQGSIEDTVILGFPIGLDVRDEFEDGSSTEGDVTITDSTIVADSMADDETAAADDDDDGFNDEGWFTAGSGNGTSDPGFDASDCMGDGGPNDAVTGSGSGAFTGSAAWVNNAWTGWGS